MLAAGPIAELRCHSDESERDDDEARICLALGRFGPDNNAEHCAVLASLIATCKLNDVDPYTYLAHILAKLVARRSMSQIDGLLPFAYVTPKTRELNVAWQHSLRQVPK